MTAALSAASAIPAALDALVAGVERSPHLGGWQVLDGEVNRELRKDWVAIGLSPDDLDIEATRIIAGLGSDLESFTILGLIRSWSGSGLVKPRRDRAFAALAAVHAVLMGDRRLGGAVTRARLTQVVYVPIRTAQGVGVEIPFRIDVDAHTTN